MVLPQLDQERAALFATLAQMTDAELESYIEEQQIVRQNLQRQATKRKIALLAFGVVGFCLWMFIVVMGGTVLLPGLRFALPFLFVISIPFVLAYLYSKSGVEEDGRALDRKITLASNGATVARDLLRQRCGPRRLPRKAT